MGWLTKYRSLHVLGLVLVITAATVLLSGTAGASVPSKDQSLQSGAHVSINGTPKGEAQPVEGAVDGVAMTSSRERVSSSSGTQAGLRSFMYSTDVAAPDNVGASLRDYKDPKIYNNSDTGDECTSGVYGDFIYVIGTTTPICFDETYGPGIWRTAAAGTVDFVMNQSGKQIWIGVEGSENSFCMNNNDAFNVAGYDVTNVNWTNSSAACTSYTFKPECGNGNPMSVVVNTDGEVFCLYHGSKLYHYKDIGDFTNGSTYRVWMHGGSGSTGYSDCFSHGAGYELTHTRDTNPNNIDTSSSNTSVC